MVKVWNDDDYLEYPFVAAARTALHADVIADDPTGIAATDTALLQEAIGDTPTRGTLILPAGGEDRYVIDSTLTVDRAMTIRGEGVHGQQLSLDDYSRSSAPSDPPYLTGTVVEQVTAATDAVHVTARAAKVNLADFGIIFAEAIRFTDTGHGIDCIPPTYSGAPSGGKDHGLFDADWRNIKVYGHDGDHYGFRFENFIHCLFTSLRSYGGGGFSFHNNGAHSWGNSVLVDFYAGVFVPGAAHAYYANVTNYGDNRLNFVTMIRPQAWVQDAGRDDIPGPPLDTQHCFYTADVERVREWTIISPDFETNVGAKQQVPIVASSIVGTGGRLASIGAENSLTLTFNAGSTYRNVVGSNILCNYSAQLDPTGEAAAEAVVEISANSGMTSPLTVARALIPAAGPTGIEVPLCWQVPASWYFRITLTNATRTNSRWIRLSI